MYINKRAEFRKAVMQLLNDANGEIVGTTRLQKTVYLLEKAKLGFGFVFHFYHAQYGPHSEDLAEATEEARVLGLIDVDQHFADWGGVYFTYKYSGEDVARNDLRAQFIAATKTVDSIVLELVALAVYVDHEKHYRNVWEEVAYLKPQNLSDSRLERAKKLYVELQHLETPVRLPDIEGTVAQSVTKAQSKQLRTVTLKEVLEGSERAAQRVAKWPEWKRKLSLSRTRTAKSNND